MILVCCRAGVGKSTIVIERGTAAAASLHSFPLRAIVAKIGKSGRSKIQSSTQYCYLVLYSTYVTSWSHALTARRSWASDPGENQTQINMYLSQDNEKEWIMILCIITTTNNMMNEWMNEWLRTYNMMWWLFRLKCCLFCVCVCVQKRRRKRMYVCSEI